MKAEAVFNYLQERQVAKWWQQDMIHTDVDLNFQLQDREDAEKACIEAFTLRLKSFSAKKRPDDRTQYPMVAFSGIVGMGKTRMLEEWKRLFEGAKIPKPYCGVLVTYGNGHS